MCAAVLWGLNQAGISVLGWANTQLLRMEWLSELVKFFVEGVMGLNVTTRLGGSIHFFIYDVIKIFIWQIQGRSATKMNPVTGG